MGIRVVEQFVEAKSDGRMSEDLVVVTDDFAAVIDGASDATGAMFAGKTGGRFGAEIVATAIAELSAADDARQFVDAISSALAAAVAATVGELGDDTRWPAAVVACASAHRREVWRVGDCNVVIGDDEHAGGKRIDAATYSFRAATNAALLAKGVPLSELVEDDPGARAMRPLVDNQQHLANTVGPWGFGCVNGQRVPDEYLEVLSVPSGPTEIIITSDGYPDVRSTLRASEARLFELVDQDPASIGELWPIGKSTKPGANAPDDRAYLRFILT
ncbi:MAG: hypothetical protein ACR2QE_18920 [Acidimicrobiales bacterium]